MLLKRWHGVDSMRGEISRLQEEMSRWFGRVPREGPLATGSKFPAVNIWREDGQVWLEVELPGMVEEDIQVLVTPENQLVLSGQRSRLHQEAERWNRRERRFGEFKRQFTLPIEVDPDRVTARLQAGILRIQLQEKERVQPRKIEVHGDCSS
ncbi:MAG: Hsp20/alpha crystallin family protein [Pirellulaceae bacterium]